MISEARLQQALRMIGRFFALMLAVIIIFVVAVVEFFMDAVDYVVKDK